MRRRTFHCGECVHFGYEDVYGIGYCLKDEKEGKLSGMLFCEEEACEDFIEDGEGQE